MGKKKWSRKLRCLINYFSLDMIDLGFVFVVLWRKKREEKEEKKEIQGKFADE